jgi:hypothetical protein
VWCALPGYSPREHPAPGINAKHYKPFYWYYIHSGEICRDFRQKIVENRTKICKKELRNLFLQNILKRDGQFCQNNPENGKKAEKSEHFL